MYLKFSDEDVVYTQIAYNQTKKGFTLVSEEGICLECEKFLELDNLFYRVLQMVKKIYMWIRG